MIDPHTNYTALQNLLVEGAAYLDGPADALFQLRPEISGWSIAEQLYHITLANASIPKLIERMKAGKLGNEEDKPFPERIAIIQEGIIPGGRQAPERVVPPSDLDAELLNRDYNRMWKATQRLEPLLDELHAIPNRFPHMFFGPLSAIEWVRFMEIHTRHHMKIVERLSE